MKFRHAVVEFHGMLRDVAAAGADPVVLPDRHPAPRSLENLTEAHFTDLKRTIMHEMRHDLAHADA